MLAAQSQAPCNAFRRGCMHRPRGRLHVCCAVKQRTGKQICCSKTLKANKGAEGEVEKLLQQVSDYSQNVQKDRKSGVILFQVAKDNFMEGTFHTWERYESVNDFSRHTMSPGVLKFMEGVQPHIEGPIGIAMYEWNDGKLGPACMNEGPKGEGGLDDATGAGGAGGASMKQTSASFDLTKGDVAEQDSEGMFAGLDAAKKRMDAWGLNFNPFGGKKTEEGQPQEKKKDDKGFFGNLWGKKEKEASK
mmetsp:Transcript_17482/g.48634  ORF Transcript_17482/g.48634 Transcript_17482/m.48634 type:complete len:247 (-) Transcript_17482:434-1174(-)